MRRSVRLAVLAAVAGLVLPVAATQTPVSAIDQDLVLSTAAGGPGTEIEVTSASCDTSDSNDTIRYLWARLISGTAPDAMLAGAAIGIDDEPATIIVPDWVDPAEPAVIEAYCTTLEFSEDPEEFPVPVREAYDPVPFDIEAGVDPAVQSRTYSRTSLQAGQGFSVQASGCFLEGADYAYVDVLEGNDLTFSEPTGIGISGEAELDGDSFEALTAMSNGGLSILIGGDSSGAESIEITEEPTDLPAGTYSSIASCSDEDGATLMFEPQLIEITGDAPFGAIDLTAAPDSRTVTLAGECSAGNVESYVFSDDLSDEFGPDAAARSGASALSPSGLTVDRAALDPSFIPATAAGDGLPGSDRLLTEEGADLLLTPAADGTWSWSDDVTFDFGLVGAYGLCGDPLGDGFFYDPQGAVVDVAPVAPTVPVTVPVTVPAPPAYAVPGEANYAG